MLNKNKNQGDEEEESSGVKFLGYLSMRTGFYIFALSDLIIVAIGSYMIYDNVLNNLYA